MDILKISLPKPQERGREEVSTPPLLGDEDKR